MTGSTILSLPDELLQHVADGLPNIGDLLSLALVCRRFRRVAQDVLYSGPISLKCTHQYRTFARTIRDRPDLRPKVKELVLKWAHRLGTEPTELSEFDDTGNVLPAPADDDLGDNNDEDERRQVDLKEDARQVLGDLFPLPTLTRLLMIHFPYPALLSLLATASSSSGLGNLKSLHIMSHRRPAPPEDYDNSPFWRSIQVLPRLETLDIVAPDIWVPQHGDEPFSHPGIRTVMFDDMPEDPLPIATLFPNLRAFTSLTGLESASVEHVLATAPPSLVQIGTGPSSQGVRSDRHLARFPNLNCLLLSPGFDPDKLAPVLRSSKITDLAFYPRSNVPDDLLLSLVSGPHKMPALKTLALCHVEPAIPSGELAEELPFHLNGVTEETVHDLVATLRQNFGATWLAGSSLEGVARAAEAAKANGIELVGTTVEMVDWEADFDRHLEKALVDAAVENANFGVLIRYYGREGALAAFARHHPENSAPPF